MCQTTEELRAAILALRAEDPEFLADLIGDVVKDNLHIKEQQRDFYADHSSHVNPKLSWGRRGTNPTTSATPKYGFGSANRLVTKTVLKTAEWETAL